MNANYFSINVCGWIQHIWNDFAHIVITHAYAACDLYNNVGWSKMSILTNSCAHAPLWYFSNSVIDLHTPLYFSNSVTDLHDILVILL